MSSMRNLWSLPLLTLLLLARSGAAQEATSDAAMLEQSRESWQRLRKECGDNYRYVVKRASFTGAGNATEIVVEGGKVVERRFREYGAPPRTPPAPGLVPPRDEFKWVEREKELGRHKEGAPSRTLDELYVEANKILARPLAKTEKRFLRFDAQGLLLGCYYLDSRIADDAPLTGVVISEIKLGN